MTTTSRCAHPKRAASTSAKQYDKMVVTREYHQHRRHSPPVPRCRRCPLFHPSLTSLLTTATALVLLPSLLISFLLWVDFQEDPYPLSPLPASVLEGAVEGRVLSAENSTVKPVQMQAPSKLKISSYTAVNSELGGLEYGLAKARFIIKQSINQRQVLRDSNYIPRGPAYRNAPAFHRSYLEMEKRFKVHVYEEGKPPLFHDGPCRSIYSTEGRFIHNMEMERHLRTHDPSKAHVHFLPFSVTKIIKYERKGFNIRPIHRVIKDHIHIIRNRYPYWNRSLGADHFMISCHDWGPNATAADYNLFNSSIRVLCNANTSEGFNPIKDVSLPEVNLRQDRIIMISGKQRASNRTLLAFFAGRLHGRIRKALVKHWKDKDDDIQVYLELPMAISYHSMMKKSKYCLCPSGWEVASPRVVEAIYLECVPVIISDRYVLPFSDVLNWEAFSVQVSVKDIPNLKNILMAISPHRYASMRRMMKVVQRHFVVRTPPQRFDLYHMILHSVWLRRLNIRIHPPG